MKSIMYVFSFCMIVIVQNAIAQSGNTSSKGKSPVFLIDGGYGLAQNAATLALTDQQKESKPAWRVGGTININSNHPLFYSLGAHYVNAGLKIRTKNASSPSVSNTIDLQYLQIPLHINYQSGQNGNFFIGAGPYIGLLVSSAQQQNDVQLAAIRKQDYGISAMAGFRLLPRWNFLVRGQWGMADIDNSVRTNLGRNQVITAGLSFSPVNRAPKQPLKKQAPPVMAHLDQNSLLFSVEEIMPVNNQNEVVYLTMAPEKSGNKLSALLSVYITIKNKSAAGKTLDRVVFECSGNGVFKVESFEPSASGKVMIKADETFTFQNEREYHELGDVLKFDNSFPTQLKIKFFFTELTDPYVVTRPLSSYQNFTKGGAYPMPVKNKDLMMDEFWYADASHGGGGQVFAYDMIVKGWDPVNKRWSDMLQGRTEDKNENFRAYGKGVYSVMDGEVLDVINTWEEAPSTSDTGTKGGNFIKINNGAETVCYYHMQKGSINKALLTKGAKVKKGDFIGLTGNSGNSSGPHIHIHIIWDPDKDGQGPFLPMQFSDVYAIDESELSTPEDNLTAPWSKLDKTGLPYIADDNRNRRNYIWNSEKSPKRFVSGMKEVVRFAIEEKDYQEEMNKLWESGYYPEWIDAYSVNGKLFFNVIGRPKSNDVLIVARHHMSTDGYTAEYNNWVNQKGYRLLHVESYKIDNQLRFAAVFSKKPNQPAQQPAYHAASGEQHQKNLDDLTKQGFVPVNISVVAINNKSYYTAFYEKRNVQFYARTTLTQEEYQDKFNELSAGNWEQVYMNTYRDDNRTKFSAIWYKRSEKPSLSAVRKAPFDVLFEKWSDNLDAGRLTRCVTGYEENDKPWFGAIWVKDEE